MDLANKKYQIGITNQLSSIKVFYMDFKVKLFESYDLK